MSLGHGASTVRNDQTFCIDFANPKSYSGSGSTVTNLQQTGNFSLVNSPTVSNGYVSCDFDTGSDGYITTSSSFMNYGSGDFTIQMLLRCDDLHLSGAYSAQPFSYLLRQTAMEIESTPDFNNDGFYLKFSVDTGTSGKGGPVFATVTTDKIPTASIIDTWILLTAIVDQTNSQIKLCVNETEYQANNTVGFSSSTDTLYIPSSDAGQDVIIGPVWSMDIDYAWIAGYSRALSATEISKNLEALRGRYGI